MDKYFRIGNIPGSFPLTIGMSALALILALVYKTPDRWLCFAAMLVSSVGDILLMDISALSKKIPHSFVGGASAFMLAHIFYLFAFLSLIRGNGLRWLSPGVWVAVVVGIALLIYILPQVKDGRMLPLLMIYLGVILLNCATVFSYSWQTFASDPTVLLPAIGVFSFLISDVIIGLGVLLLNHKYDGLIWWFYPIGQILLIIFG